MKTPTDRKFETLGAAAETIRYGWRQGGCSSILEKMVDLGGRARRMVRRVAGLHQRVIVAVLWTGWINF